MENPRLMAERMVEGRVHDRRSVVDAEGRRFLVKARHRPYLPKKGSRVGFVPRASQFRGSSWALEVFSAQTLDLVLSIRS